MRPRRFPWLLAGLLLCASVLSTVQAQSAQRWSVQVSAIGVGGGGDAFSGVSTGWGGEAQFRYTPSAFSLGVGVQYSRHDFKDADLGTVPVHYYGGFAEPRYVIDIRSPKLAPYLSARLAWLSQKADFEQFAASAKGSGFQVNGGGGVLIRLSAKINLDLGATFGNIHFGDYIVKQDGQEIGRVAGGNGTNFVGRVGLAIGLR
jgi:hypothetical protein